LEVRRGELALKVKTASPRNLTSGTRQVGQIGLEKVGNGRKWLSILTERSQQTPNRDSKGRIVVNDQDGGPCVRHRLLLTIKD
jgi:hypothetical protein